MRIFISYNSKYRDFAIHLRDILREWGYQTWFDVEDIPKGAYFRHEIQKGLESSQVVIGVMTPEAFESREVMWEWDYAIYHSRFIPLKYVEAKLPYHLQGTQFIDFTHDQSRAFKRLQNELAAPTQPATLTQAAAKPTVPATSTPTTPKPRDENRARMLTKVRDNWIQGVLHNALRDSQFQLGMELKPDAVIKHVDYEDYTLPDTSGILQVFDDMRRELLILGAPGAGKTILLLQLAEKLLERAQTDEAMPIPVVFNLASWADKRLSLRDWLADRLFLEYQVPRKIGKRWIDDEKLLPLLDGLDEVKEIARNTCVEVINAFRSQYRSVDLVVCSRIADYDLLTTKLNLQCAFVLQPLSNIEIDHFLAHSDFAALREAIKSDSKLREMAATPFLLNTLMYTYRQAKTSDVEHFQNEDERQTDLFNKYIFKSFHQKPQNQYTLAQTKQWLCWLASKLVDYKQTVFYIESLQPSWLAPKGYRSLMSWKFDLTIVFVVAVIVGVICALFGSIFMFAAFSLNVPLDGVIAGAIFSGIAVGLAAGNERIDIAESVKWSLSRSSLLIMMVGRLANMFLFAYIGLLIGVLFDRIYFVQDWEATQNWRFVGTAVGAFLGFLISFIFELPMGLRTSESMEMRTRPNQGIWLSTLNVFKVTSTGGVFVGTILGLIIGVAFEFAFQLTGSEKSGFMLGFPFGLIVGIGGGLATGGIDAIIKHLMLRIALTYYGCTPFNYAQFLNFCASLGLMRKVGGGYIFQHRILLEYFAVLWDSSPKTHQGERSHRLKLLTTTLSDIEAIMTSDAEQAFTAIDDTRTLDSLILALHDKDETVRYMAVATLGKIGDSKAVEPLIAALRDKHEGVRRIAAQSLGKIGDARAIEPLITALRTQDGWGRNYAADALVQIGDARAIEPLIATLHHQEWSVRNHAANAILEISNADTVPLLITAFHENSSDGRYHIVWLLGESDDVRTVTVLEAALRDKNEHVRQAAAGALGKMSDPSAVDVLIAGLHDDWTDVRRIVAEKLGEIAEPKAVEPLIDVLRDKNVDIRSKAAEALGVIGDTNAVIPLIGVLHDRSEMVRGSAVWALGKIGDAIAIGPLTAALRDKSKDVYKRRICDLAAEALERIGTDEALEALRQWRAGE